ncbi:hypothetical protein Desca_2422 [Desulfotomaculum nigrificans CO-1-SRB]|uniref:Uncharacterized protein n=1 Tax=Desulfotomaculum nigrificans (strain DSM 14880 / VKM B-2319 / CO-1-SRB) TaxID=868595 RepID=F6B473_DESCC|nr:hypothetical protein [Desulfotomaculum nigrificans]AEF95250.1 hypothetical protein Desca_2422 [Desulfotomaculum nigrificans CO-1-SRB]
MEALLNFYNSLTKTQLLLMFITVTLALVVLVVGFGRKYKE